MQRKQGMKEIEKIEKAEQRRDRESSAWKRERKQGMKAGHESRASKRYR